MATERLPETTIHPIAFCGRKVEIAFTDSRADVATHVRAAQFLSDELIVIVGELAAADEFVSSEDLRMLNQALALVSSFAAALRDSAAGAQP